MTDPNDLDDLDALLDEAVDIMDAQEKEHDEAVKQREAKLEEDLRKALSEQESAANGGGAGDFTALLQTLMTASADGSAGADGVLGDDFFTKFKNDVNALVSSLEGTPDLQSEDLANLARVKELMAVMETDDEEKVREVVEKIEKDGDLKVEESDAEVDAALRRCMDAVGQLNPQADAAGAARPGEKAPASASPASTHEPTEAELKAQLKAAADAAAAAATSEDASPENMASLLFDALLNPEFVEPIKVMRDAYGPYLQEQGDKLTSEEKAKYMKQHDKTIEICEFLSVPIDKEDGERVTKLLDMMHEFAELGEPPKELAAYTKKSE